MVLSCSLDNLSVYGSSWKISKNNKESSDDKGGIVVGELRIWGKIELIANGSKGEHAPSLQISS